MLISVSAFQLCALSVFPIKGRACPSYRLVLCMYVCIFIWISTNVMDNK